jgi:integrase/recombinase XerD
VYLFTHKKKQSHAKKKSITHVEQQTMFRCSRPEFSAVLRQFYTHLQLNGRAESTIISYARAVRDLMEMTGKVTLDLREPDIIAHLTQLRDSRDLSSSALNARISALKYLYRDVLRRLDIVVDLPNPRRARLVTEILTEAEVRQLFARTNSIKHLAILHLLFDTGLRAR